MSYDRHKRQQRNYNQKGNRNNKLTDIIDTIKNDVKMLKDIPPRKYANVGGYADEIAKHFSSGYNQLKTNQLRKLFGAIREIELKETWQLREPEFYLLKPKIAASVGRELIPKDFYKLIIVCMEKVDEGSEEDKMENFKTLVNFLEAIVAYRKYYEKG